MVHKLSEALERATPRPRGRYSVPLRTLSTYVDRHELSSALEKKLHAGGNDTDSPFALLIHGLGGTGKTQLALKYIEEYRDNYDPVLWIDAKSPEAVRSSFERCANAMQLHVDSTPTTGTELADNRTIQAVLRFLESRKSSDDKWLIVIDNADDFSWGLRTVLPQAGWGSLIITSQDSQAWRLFPKREKLQVDIMGPLEARAVFLHHLQWESVSVPSRVQLLCDNIVRRLGYLALAVDLAGAYIGNEADQEKALAQYLVDYGKHQDDLLQWDHFRGLSESSKTVWTVWDNTLHRIQELEPKANPDLLLTFFARFRGSIVQEELFRLASQGLSVLKEYFGEENEILPAWIEAWIGLNEDQWDSFNYRTARNILVRYSLLQRADGEWPAVTMHSLVQWRAMKREENRQWDVWHLLFITAVCIQSNKESSEPHFRRHIIPQILEGSALKMAARGFDEQEKIFIESIIGRVFNDEGRWKEAEELNVHVMKIRKRVLGEEHPATLTIMANLASTYRDQGRWTEAKELEVQVMKIRKRVLGEEHPATLTIMANLASTYRDQGRWTEAKELEVQVMKIRKRVLGEEHPATLTIMANLASTYRDQGRWKEAEELEVQVMKSSKRVLGEEHPDTLTSMANLASTYRNQGRWKEAEELEVQVMEIRKRVLGEEHPDTLFSIANFATTRQIQGRWTEVEELGVQVMEISKRVLGEEHPDTLTIMANLGWTYQDQGRWREAEELEVQVTEVRKRVLGEEHPSTLTSMANLASTYRNQGRWKEAEELEVQVMEIRKRVLGEEHPDTLTIMANLGWTYWNQGRWKEAEELEVQVMEIRKRVLGEEHPDTLFSIANFATTCQIQGRWKEAEELGVQVMEISKRVLGEEHPSTLTIMANLASTYRDQGRWTEAKELEVQVMETNKRLLPRRGASSHVD